MQLDQRTLDSLVEEITKQVLSTLKEQTGKAVPAVLPVVPVACPTCEDHGAQHRPDVARQALQDGASRLSATLGMRTITQDVAQYIDHTLLKPDASQAQIAQLCEEARQYKFATVCVNPTNVRLCSQLLRGSGVGVCVVVGFPLGATPTKVKCYEAQQAINDGATEVDMVINVGALKSKDYELVEQDIAAVTRTCHNNGACCKVIIEAALLTDDEKIKACQLAKAAGADYVKTSTGFGPGGATLHDVALMRQTVGPEMGIKAAGGIRTYQDTVAMLEAGATRIGASASVKIVQGARAA
jgi:deoxyribose-phosphate aldolase